MLVLLVLLCVIEGLLGHGGQQAPQIHARHILEARELGWEQVTLLVGGLPRGQHGGGQGSPVQCSSGRRKRGLVCLGRLEVTVAWEGTIAAC